ncbi:FHA domain-containing protein [Leptothermofonsia sp. ETS-13]|uniref:FHA domain-containing protein n=1 Tax=Leptothermofonsia sp. ETS-13 TaxID=3035696 RepID=UPI003BA0A782
MAISLELIYPSGLTSLQNWTFENESVIRIGRDSNNHVVLHSKVVSRFHAMLWGFGNEWKIVNLSSNGTYLNNAPVPHALLTTGTIIRLAPSGPQIRFRLLVNRLIYPPKESSSKTIFLTEGLWRGLKADPILNTWCCKH